MHAEPQYELPVHLSSSPPEPTLTLNQAYAPVRLLMNINESYGTVYLQNSNLHTPDLEQKPGAYNEETPTQVLIDTPNVHTEPEYVEIAIRET